MASRILGMGDVESLIEKAQNAIDDEKAKEMEQKFRKASFDFNDFMEQMDQLEKMGGIGDLLSMMPGMSSQMKNVQIDEDAGKKPKAIIQSMTPNERCLKRSDLTIQKETYCRRRGRSDRGSQPFLKAV